jgi:recombination protein RecR
MANKVKKLLIDGNDVTFEHYFRLMDSSKYTSKLLERAVNEFSKLPGVGRKTALRLVLHLLKQDISESEALANSLLELRKEIHHCKICHNISYQEICQVCSNPARDRSLICVVENIRDVMAIESTQQYTGVYHVLGGIISPMDGIGPANLTVGSLTQRVSSGNTREVILALSATMEGDATNFFIYRKLSEHQVKITTLARGVAVGNELEFTDEITLGRSLINRTLFEESLRKI